MNGITVTGLPLIGRENSEFTKKSAPRERVRGKNYSPNGRRRVHIWHLEIWKLRREDEDEFNRLKWGVVGGGRNKGEKKIDLRVEKCEGGMSLIPSLGRE